MKKMKKGSKGNEEVPPIVPYPGQEHQHAGTAVIDVGSARRHYSIIWQEFGYCTL